MNWVSIGSDNGFSPSRRQAVIWTNPDLSSIAPLGTELSEIWTKIQKRFIHENVFENVVNEMSVILSRGR